MTVQPIALTEPEARRLTERIRTALDRVSTAWADLGERITEAFERRADIALGYGSWAEYAEAELQPSGQIAADVRRQLVAMLSAQSMSPRAIAPTIGVTRQRVSQIRIVDLRTFGKGDPIATLVRRVQAMHQDRSRRYPSTSLYLLFRAWNAYRAGEMLQKFQLGSEGRWASIPEPK